MSKILYVSDDNGQLYMPDAVDGATAEAGPVEGFWRIRVPEVIVLDAERLTAVDGSISEMLLASGVGTMVSDGDTGVAVPEPVS